MEWKGWWDVFSLLVYFSLLLFWGGISYVKVLSLKPIVCVQNII